MSDRPDGDRAARLATLATAYRGVRAPARLAARIVAGARPPRRGGWLPLAAAAGVTALTIGAVMILPPATAPVPAARQAALPLLPSLAGLTMSGTRLPAVGGTGVLPTLPATPRPEDPEKVDTQETPDGNS